MENNNKQFCTKCGAELEEGQEFCCQCGQNVKIANSSSNRKEKDIAVVSLILSIMGFLTGFFYVGIAFDIISIILAIIIFVKSKSKPIKINSAVASTIISTISLILCIVMFWPTTPSKELLNDVKEHYSNGEYQKAIDIANDLIEKYPDEKEVKKAKEIILDSNNALAEELLTTQKRELGLKNWDKVIEINEKIVNISSDEKIIDMSKENAVAATEEIKKSDIENIDKAYSSKDYNTVVKLTREFTTKYPDTEEAKSVKKRLEDAKITITDNGKKSIEKLNDEYDTVQNLTWYFPKSKPKYVDTRSAVYVYLAEPDYGEPYLRWVMSYTGNEWIFFDKVTISVDGQKYYKTFKYNGILRDNDTEVWEVADFIVTNKDRTILEKIANSEETIVRFEGNYTYDKKVSGSEKQGIKDVLNAYDYVCIK